MLGLRRNDRADVRETMHELGQKALVDINRELLKPKLQAFQKIEPLFCELFWNRDKGVEVKYVPKSYVRHLLQRRLKYSVDQQHDERQAETAAANFLFCYHPPASYRAVPRRHWSISAKVNALVKSRGCGYRKI